jgi:hypothetical protein
MCHTNNQCASPVTAQHTRPTRVTATAHCAAQLAPALNHLSAMVRSLPARRCPMKKCKRMELHLCQLQQVMERELRELQEQEAQAKVGCGMGRWLAFGARVGVSWGPWRPRSEAH